MNQSQVCRASKQEKGKAQAWYSSYSLLCTSPHSLNALFALLFTGEYDPHKEPTYFQLNSPTKVSQNYICLALHGSMPGIWGQFSVYNRPGGAGAFYIQHCCSLLDQVISALPSQSSKWSCLKSQSYKAEALTDNFPIVKNKLKQCNCIRPAN